MRQLKQLNTKHIKQKNREHLAALVAAETISRFMPEDIKCQMKWYITQYPTTWWIKFNEDTGHALESLFGSGFYSEKQFGIHNLKPEFLAIIERALNMG
jgi:hypothetical protein